MMDAKIEPDESSSSSISNEDTETGSDVSSLRDPLSIEGTVNQTIEELKPEMSDSSENSNNAADLPELKRIEEKPENEERVERSAEASKQDSHASGSLNTPTRKRNLPSLDVLPGCSKYEDMPKNVINEELKKSKHNFIRATGLEKQVLRSKDEPAVNNERSRWFFCFQIPIPPQPEGVYPDWDDSKWLDSYHPKDSILDKNIKIMLKEISEESGSFVNVSQLQRNTSWHAMFSEFKTINNDDINRLFCEIGLSGKYVLNTNSDGDPKLVYKHMFNLIKLIHRIIEVVLRTNMAPSICKKELCGEFSKHIKEDGEITIKILEKIFIDVANYAAQVSYNRVFLNEATENDLRTIDDFIKEEYKKNFSPEVVEFLSANHSNVINDFLESRIVQQCIKFNEKITHVHLINHYINRQNKFNVINNKMEKNKRKKLENVAGSESEQEDNPEVLHLPTTAIYAQLQQPTIDPTGQLIEPENFGNVSNLERIDDSEKKGKKRAKQCLPEDEPIQTADPSLAGGSSTQPTTKKTSIQLEETVGDYIQYTGVGHEYKDAAQAKTITFYPKIPTPPTVVLIEPPRMAKSVLKNPPVPTKQKTQPINVQPGTSRPAKSIISCQPKSVRFEEELPRSQQQVPPADVEIDQESSQCSMLPCFATLTRRRSAEYTQNLAAFRDNINSMLSWISDAQGTVINLVDAASHQVQWVPMPSAANDAIELNDNDLGKLFCEIGLTGTYYIRSWNSDMLNLMMLIHRLIDLELVKHPTSLDGYKESFRKTFCKYIGGNRIITLDNLNQIFEEILQRIIISRTREILDEQGTLPSRTQLSTITTEQERSLLDPEVINYLEAQSEVVTADFFVSSYFSTLMCINRTITMKHVQHYFINRGLL